MILPFSTKLNGKPTYFVEKIFKGIKKALNDETYYKIAYSIPPGEMLKPYKLDVDKYHEVYSKIHTIREDKKDRWKPGTMIDFYINTRTKDMFRFAPRIPVVSTQKIKITHIGNTRNVSIDNMLFYFGCPNDEYQTIMIDKMLSFAQNDGFDTLKDFFAYFNEDFTGKIIHWTDKRY